MIKPQELIDKFGVEGLCKNAELYFANIENPTPQMGKPFSSLIEGPPSLFNLSLLLMGLKLSKTMKVLDFGAGTCWLSKYLNQLQCCTISIDASETALEIGKKLFRDNPIIGNFIAEPKFLIFNGYNIQLPDESVDRIICFDTFHHIPNQEQILSEFARVLKNGGIAGFSEPGKNHSQHPQSQYEMANYKVLENNIDTDEIYKISTKFGFTDISFKVLQNPELEINIEEYKEILNLSSSNIVMNKIWSHIKGQMSAANIFFLHKGKHFEDSRGHIGLSHSIQVNRKKYISNINEKFYIDVEIKNTGTAKWLNSNIGDIGVVKLGVHLYDNDKELIDLDFYKSKFDTSINPGEIINKKIELSISKRGNFILSLDMVSEAVCWFENVGSNPIYVEVTVQ